MGIKEMLAGKQRSFTYIYKKVVAYTVQLVFWGNRLPQPGVYSLGQRLIGYELAALVFGL